MLHLTVLSVPLAAVAEATLATDPLVAADWGYAVKCWLSDRPGLACRPWRAVAANRAVRITGWRSAPPVPAERSIYVGMQEVALEPGQHLAVAGRFIPVRRQGKTPTRPHARSRDAAEGRADPREAYTAWLRERLIDVMPFAEIEDVDVQRTGHDRVLRKTSRGRLRLVRSVLNPVAEATVSMRVRDAAGVEAWLLRGVGEQKAFGYGAFLPTLVETSA